MHRHDGAAVSGGHEVVQDLGPILPRWRLAPTATTRGAKNAFIDSVAATRDLAAA